VACGGGGGERTSSARPPSLADGRAVFVSAGCGGCHTLSAAGTHGTLGPNFDTSERLNAAQILQQLDVGAGGMPSYEGRLTERQRRSVSAFVAATMR
jgi:mono/diheme cytochrome c family protein